MGSETCRTPGPFVEPCGVALARLEGGAFAPGARGGDPLDGLPGPTLGDPSGEMYESSLPPDLALDAMSGVNGRLLGQATGELIASHPLVGMDPPERDLIAPVNKAGADLDDGPGPLNEVCVCYLLFISRYMLPEVPW